MLSRKHSRVGRHVRELLKHAALALGQALQQGIDAVDGALSHHPELVREERGEELHQRRLAQHVDVTRERGQGGGQSLQHLQRADGGQNGELGEEVVGVGGGREEVNDAGKTATGEDLMRIAVGVHQLQREGRKEQGPR